MRLLIPTASAQSANMSITTQYKMRRIVHTNNHINIGMVLLAGSENRASLQVNRLYESIEFKTTT